MIGTRQICGGVHHPHETCEKCKDIRASAKRIPSQTHPVAPKATPARQPLVIDTGKTLELQAKVAELELALAEALSRVSAPGKTDDGVSSRAPVGECAYCDRQRAKINAATKARRGK